ncbi:MAG: pantetheine-phosphate adenylyltransferase [Candidatus Eisenbacteria bacterium]|nr:pantetheine-phosphate adenylyltransferase [Candidatus Eisenbacteria bacterium]
MKKALFPGTFDPVTNGHIDLMERALRLFDRLTVAVGHRGEKDVLFSVEERVDMLRETTRHMGAIEVTHFGGLLVNYAQDIGADVVIRGLRFISDFEYEFQMALMNRRLSGSLEAVFLMPSEQYSYLNSTLVKEIVRLGGSVNQFVPPTVEERLKRKLAQREEL